tara:strand:- start:7 stop:657 length:651 start_codon:yes stop_codon:yes gene_type:complete
MSKNKIGYSFKEEYINTVTHILGLCVSIFGSFFLIANVVTSYQDWRYIFSAIVFSMSLILMYSCSSLYHGVRNDRLKIIFRKFDHCAIYILIAGSYTPFTLTSMYLDSGLFLFIFIWILAFFGIIVEFFLSKYSFFISMILYLVMGWFVLFFWESLSQTLHNNGLILIISGGVFYTLGVIFFIWERIPYNHAIWHVFVLAGSISHYFAVLYCFEIM